MFVFREGRRTAVATLRQLELGESASLAKALEFSPKWCRRGWRWQQLGEPLLGDAESPGEGGEDGSGGKVGTGGLSARAGSLPRRRGTRGVIRSVAPGDAGAIVAIYNHYIAHTVATFEEEPVASVEMEGRIRGVTGRFPWLVFEEGGEILGYSYAKAWHGRSAYRYAIESTVYLHPDATGRGVGGELYATLLAQLDGLGLHRAVGVIALPNPASVALHEALGFQKVAHLSELGWKFERWIDVGYWERAFGTRGERTGAGRRGAAGGAVAPQRSGGRDHRE